MKRNSQRTRVRVEPVLDAGVKDESDCGFTPRISTRPARTFRPREIKTDTGTDAGDDNPATIADTGFRRRVILFASLLLLLSVLLFAADQLLSPDSFEVEELRISADLTYISPQDVRKEVLAQIRNNYFAVNLKQVEQAVREMPWVDKVSVRRQWPRSIHIRLMEQQPVARWGDEGFLNARAGFFRVGQPPASLEALPRLHGPPGTEKQLLELFDRWKELLAGEQLDLEGLEMSPRYSVRLVARIPRDQQKILTEQALMDHFSKNEAPLPVIDWHRIQPFTLSLTLGKDEVEERLDRFLSVYPEAFEDQLLRVSRIDLRYPNGFAVKWRGDEVPQEFLQLAVTVEKKS